MGIKNLLRKLSVLIVSLAFLGTASPQNFGAGVTLITHGLEGDTDGWVTSMLNTIPTHPRYLGTNYAFYRMSITSRNGTLIASAQQMAGGDFFESNAGEILIALDWRTVADGWSFNTYEVAAAVVPHLLSTNFIPELEGHALSELPLHLIGHSRGGSLVCEISRLLGQNGVWVDHLTTLDPHPLNNDGFFDVPLYWNVDASAQTYDNVLFHDNYFQTIGWPVTGKSVRGAYVRELSPLLGGYTGVTGAHSDVHLWYHGTIDFRLPTHDSAAWITETERNTWWTETERFGTAAGFDFSRIGGGDRLGTNRPAGIGASQIAEGYNQRWEFGAGTSGNRTLLSINSLEWPNVIKINLTGTNRMVQGQSNTLSAYVQPSLATGSDARLGFYLDRDLNPWNGNERLLNEISLNQNPTYQVGFGKFGIVASETNSTPGTHALFGKITGGGKTRYLYAPELLTVFSSAEPVRVAIAGGGGLLPRVDVMGTRGQRVLLEDSVDLKIWQALSTNWLTEDIWRYFDTRPTSQTRFYRAVLK